MPVPVMNIQAYTADEIYNNSLFFLIPFYSIRYEKRLNKISRKNFKNLSKKQVRKILAANKVEYDRIYSELKEYFDRLMKACEAGLLSEDDTRNLAELSKIILSHITRKLESDLKERMVALLGGQVLELRQDIWFKQGEQIGFERGERQGEQIGFERGERQRDREKITDMLRRGKTPEEIADFCAYPMDLINEIQKELQS